MLRRLIPAAVAALILWPASAFCQTEIVEIYCPSCGFRERFVQGADEEHARRNLQHVIVVCERSREVRTIQIPLDPESPVDGGPFVARQYGMGSSKFLGVRLPKFLVPGNTCPLFPITAYLEADVCPVDGRPGVHFEVLGYY
jgi:hypothetical protein